MINERFKVLAPQEAGWTEDEYNNFLIDIWSAMNKKVSNDPPMYEYFDVGANKVMLSPTPITVTLTFKQQLFE